MHKSYGFFHFACLYWPEKKIMQAEHVFMKGRNGWGIFYGLFDCLVYFTLYSVLARRMGLCVLAFSIMFNHTHSLIAKVAFPVIKLFQRRLGIIYSKDYNEEHNRSGGLFKRPFGHSLKKITKKVLACIAYIFNNPVAGKMCRYAIDSKWTLLAYYNNPNPFSKKLVKRNCRHIMRESLKVVDTIYKEGNYLNYATLKRIYNGLNSVEKAQLTDYIINKYNFLDYKELERIYGSFDKALIAIESNAGEEYEIEDEYGDHSNYSKMISITKECNLGDVYCESLSDQQVMRLSRLFYSKLNASTDQIRKYLHLPSPRRQINKCHPNRP